MSTDQSSTLLRNNFHQVMDHEETDLFILRNRNNVRATFTNFGARWVSMEIPVNGTMYNVVAGYESLQQYVKSSEAYYGAVVGRYANRIANGKFTLNGKQYQLGINNFPNHLHGGKNGFHNVVWTVLAANDHSLSLEYFSKDGEENYPGNLNVRLTYTLTDEDELEVLIQATTDADTPVNIVHHSFFNLNGFDKGDIFNHTLMINANYFTPVDETLIPAGEIRSVANTPFDFRSAKKLGANIFDDDEQLKFGKGYDHNFVLNKTEPFSLAAIATGNISNISLEVYTLEPGLQLYSGNVMTGKNKLNGGFADERFHAFCLETQHFPDSPNQPAFPSTIVKPGDDFQTRTVFKFKYDH